MAKIMFKQSDDLFKLFLRAAAAFIVGAAILSLFATWQKRALNTSLTWVGYTVPVLFGGISGLLLHIWQQKSQRALEQSQTSDRVYRALVEQAADGIFIANEHGDFIDVNESGCAMIGYGKEEVLTMGMGDLTPPGEQTGHPLNFDSIVMNKPTMMVRQIARKDGALIWVEINSKRLADGRLQAIVRDITQRQEAKAEREQLLDAEKEQRLRAETMSSVILALTSQTDRQAVLDEIMRQSRRIVAHDAANIALLSGSALRTVGWLGYEPFGGFVPNPAAPRPMTAFEPDARAVQTRQAVIISDTYNDPHWIAFEETRWIRSYLVMPIALHDQVLGLLRLDSQKTGSFAQPDAERLRPLVNAAAVALENARLYEEAQQELRERKQAEAALRASEERFRRLMQESPVGVEVYSPDGTLLDVNKAWESAWGAAADDVIGQYNPLKTKIFEAMGIMDLIERAFAGEVVELPDVAFDPAQIGLPGRKRWIRSRVYHIKDEDGRLQNVVLLSEDITDHKQAEEALLQAQKTESLGILAGGVAHDFNNLLVAMLGQTSLAQVKLRDESPARPHIQKAVKAAERAADLTRQMLAYSGRGHFETRHINLNHLIAENLHLFQASIPKNVQLQSNLADALPLVEADPGQMQQVLMNMILNGAQAIEERPGRVTVTTGVEVLGARDGRYTQYTGDELAPGHYVALQIHDNGQGMDAVTLSKIFDPFFSMKETGHGLGLAAVLGIMRGHRGGVLVSSEPGQGSTFKLLFPASAAAAALPTAVNATSESETAVGLVLVIDDELPVREAVIDILDLENIGVITAAGGVEGIALYRERMAEIDLVLLDLSMPGMNGEETFRKLRQIDPHVRVILSSGYNQIEATRQFTGKGLAAFVQKPYTVATLVAAVKQHMP